MRYWAVRRFAAGLVGGLGLACSSDASAPGSPPNTAIDLDSTAFRPPLAIGASTANVFDHDLPFEFSDTNGYLLSFWGEKVGGIDGHNGYDWLVPQGTPVLASGPGTVTFAGLEKPFVCTLLGDSVVAGNWVSVSHRVSSNLLVFTQYGHFSRVDVGVGQHVQAGQQLGLSGSTGCSTTPHLHFSVFRAFAAATPGPIVMDPYGWQSTTGDPWANDGRGAASFAIWSPSNAPAIYTEYVRGVTAFPKPRVASVPLVRVMGVDDDHHPNNEFIDVDINPDLPTLDLTGFAIANATGDRYVFPAGFTARGGDTIRVYSGKGTSTAKTLYMGRDTPMYADRADCAVLLDQLHRPLGGAVWRSSCPPAQISGAVGGEMIRIKDGPLDLAPSSAAAQRLGIPRR